MIDTTGSRGFFTSGANASPVVWVLSFLFRCFTTGWKARHGN